MNVKLEDGTGWLLGKIHSNEDRTQGKGHSLMSGIRGCAAQKGPVSQLRTPELGILFGLGL